MDTLKEKWEEVYEREDLPWVKNPLPLQVLEKFTNHLKKGDKILDYGGGDGLLSEILVEKGLDVICSDISEKALLLAKKKIPELKTVQASNPSVFVDQGDIFDGILVWGVMHHVDNSEWENYLKSFYLILKEGGTLLIGGHSDRDSEFSKGFRISPTTGQVSHAVNGLGELSVKAGFSVQESDFFEFQEAFSGSKRVFKYFLLRK